MSFDHHQDALSAATRLMEARARLVEGLSLDLYDSAPLWAQLAGLDDPEFLVGGLGANWSAGLAYMDRRKRGEFIPIWLNETQLRWYRKRLRSVVVSSPTALNVIGVYQAYSVGEGTKFEAVARKGKEAGDL